MKKKILGFIGIVLILCIVGVIWCFPRLYFAAQFVNFTEYESESNDNITFNLSEFDKQIIYNIYSKKFFVGNVYVPLELPSDIGSWEEITIKQRKNDLLCQTDEGKRFLLHFNNNKVYFVDRENMEILYKWEGKDSAFFFWGMGLRNKFLLYENEKGLYNLYDFTAKTEKYTDIEINRIDAEYYQAEGVINEQKFYMYENEDGIYVEINGKKSVLDDSCHINIPEYNGTKARELRILFNETMINITKEGPKPNFVTYAEPFYRDAAYVAMVCEKTGNISQVSDWISNITEIYDLQRDISIEEPDNLGELLYMQSLLEEPNQELIDKIIEEAYSRRKDGMLTGIMDGEEHHNYTTGWLKFGMETLGMDSSDWRLDSELPDSYTSLLWFYNSPELEEYRKNTSYSQNSLWPYLEYGRANFYDFDLSTLYEKNNDSYMSYEPANSDAWRLISENLDYIRSSTPHAWASSEMFFYYLQFE